jgi:uncharacterized protein (TIGR00255 family)
MTGYGSATAEVDGVVAGVEIRTVNHRHLDVRVHAGPGLAAAAAEVERRIRSRLDRGRIDAYLEVQSRRPDGDLDAAIGDAWRRLDVLRRSLGLERPVDVGDALRLLEMEAPPTRPGAAGVEACVRAAARAVEEVDAMREREGGAIAGMLERRMAEMARLREAIAARIAEVRAGLPGRLRERMALLARAADVVCVDPDRLAREVALMLDRGDAGEELDRLAGHLEHLRRLLCEPGPIGRRAVFLTQEAVREAGTAAAKAQDAEVTRQVAEFRSLAEQMREQLENVE